MNGDKNNTPECRQVGPVYSDEPEESNSRVSTDPTINSFRQKLLDLYSPLKYSNVNGLCDKKFAIVELLSGK